MLAAAVLALGGGVLYWDLRVRKHYEYYNAFAKREGVFKGVGRVSAADARHRSRTLRFDLEGRHGPVTQVKAIDGSGACARAGIQDPTIGGADPATTWDNPTRLCSISWERDSKGRVSKQTMLDATGRVLASLVYTDEDGRTAELRAEKGRLLPIGVATTITYERIKGGPNRGQDRLERYTDAFGQPKRFLTGAFAGELNTTPRVCWFTPCLLDRTASQRGIGPASPKSALATMKPAVPSKSLCLMRNGHPVRNKDGVARWA